MSHPITGNKRSVLIYSIVWLLVSALQGFLYWYILNFPWPVAVTDALFSNFLFGFMGLLAWYPTRYIPFQRHSPFYSIMAHVVAGLLVLFVWVLITIGLLNGIFADHQAYIEFLNRSLAWRAGLGGLVYLVLVLIYYLVSNNQKLQERTQQQERLKVLVRDTELSMLKSQINPHFLFNTLNNIYTLSLKKSDQTPEVVIKLSEMLDYLLYQCNSDNVLLKSEIRLIENYLYLQEIRYDKRLKIDFQIEGKAIDQVISPMLLLPFIENSFKHGIGKHRNAAWIKIKLLIQDKSIDFQVKNSYQKQGLEQEKNKSGGIGLSNVRKRLDLIYKNNHELKILSTDREYSVQLKLNTAA